jgi:hypothetical protein
LYICSEKNVEHGGNLCTACWVQKALDFRWLQASLCPFFASRAGVEEWVFCEKILPLQKKSYLCNGKVNNGFAKVKGCSSAIPRNDSAAAGLAGEMSKRKCD